MDNTQFGYRHLVNESSDMDSGDDSFESSTDQQQSSNGNIPNQLAPTRSVSGTKIGYHPLVNESSDMDPSDDWFGSSTDQQPSSANMPKQSLWSQGYTRGAGHGKLI